MSKIAPCRARNSINLERQVKELEAVRNYLAGLTDEENVPQAVDRAARQEIAAELLAAMTSRERGEASISAEGVSSGDASEPASNKVGIVPEEEARSADQEPKERARKLFMDHGYFDEAVQDLRDGISPQQRANAARALGVVGSKRGTPHLIAAMFDDDPEVRSAAEESLAQMSDSTNFSVESIAPASGHGDLEESKVTYASSFFEYVSADETELKEPIPLDQAEPELVGASHEVSSHQTEVHEDSGNPSGNTQTPVSSVGAVELNTRLQPGTKEASQQRIHSTPGVRQETSQETQHETIEPPNAAKEPGQLLQEEQSLREAAQQLERQLAARAIARSELEKEVVLSIERETRFRAEAAAKRRQEDELRKQADEETEVRRANEREALKAEQLTREQAETEAHLLAEEEGRTRLEKVNLRKAAEELAWRRMEIENARRETEEAARLAQAKNSREEAEKLHDAELAQTASRGRGAARRI